LESFNRIEFLFYNFGSNQIKDQTHRLGLVPIYIY